ncbi:hypothetical protein [Lysinibacillus sp. JNUCC 51]|uniref:hypothetical protein n=1 Tax=Lysinibacillus sp. JNUCC-51 TaxID=2792479 RepID=UPI0019369FE7|nr:hypothetical protein JNUCC51_01805 [Lysinibacillus sp. JNUCC-51]
MRNEEYSSFSQLLGELINGNSKKQSTFLIGIDGCGGSGKSTFADKIKEEYGFLDRSDDCTTYWVKEV